MAKQAWELLQEQIKVSSAEELKQLCQELLAENLQENFNQSMNYWEQAINHYLRTGKKLMKTL